jgi:hypothetical protein
LQITGKKHRSALYKLHLGHAVVTLLRDTGTNHSVKRTQVAFMGVLIGLEPSCAAGPHDYNERQTANDYALQKGTGGSGNA